jgi:hypothetical protein
MAQAHYPMLWKLCREKRLQPLLGDGAMLVSDLLRHSHQEFKAIVAQEIADMDEAHLGAEHVRGPVYVRAMAAQDGEKSTGNKTLSNRRHSTIQNLQPQGQLCRPNSRVRKVRNPS